MASLVYALEAEQISISWCRDAYNIPAMMLFHPYKYDDMLPEILTLFFIQFTVRNVGNRHTGPNIWGVELPFHISALHRWEFFTPLSLVTGGMGQPKENTPLMNSHVQLHNLFQISSLLKNDP